MTFPDRIPGSYLGGFSSSLARAGDLDPCMLPFLEIPPLVLKSSEASWAYQESQGRLSHGLPKHRAGPGCSYPKSDLPVSTHLKIEAMWAIPVAVDDVYFAVTVEICQGHTSAMLMRVVYTWGGEEGALGCYPLHVP